MRMHSIVQEPLSSPRRMALHVFGPVFWLAVILPCAFPCEQTQWQMQSRQAYSSGGCAGITTEVVHRLPVSIGYWIGLNSGYPRTS